MSSPKTWLQSEAIAITLLVACLVMWGVWSAGSFIEEQVHSALKLAGL